MLAFSALTLQPQNAVGLVLQQLRELLRRGKLELCQQLEVCFLGTERNCMGKKKKQRVAFGMEMLQRKLFPFLYRLPEVLRARGGTGRWATGGGALPALPKGEGSSGLGSKPVSEKEKSFVAAAPCQWSVGGCPYVGKTNRVHACLEKERRSKLCSCPPCLQYLFQGVS